MTTPTLGELLLRTVSTALAGVNTALPARVVRFYPEERKADVQPLIRKQMADGTTMDYPTILAVPICYPASGQALFYFPLAAGDSLLLVFSQASTDNWLFSQTKTPVDPEDDTRFNISDAFAIPGVFPFPLSTTIWGSQTLTKDTSSVIIKHNIGKSTEAEIVIKADGSISMESPTSVSIKAPDLNVIGKINATGIIKSDTDVVFGPLLVSAVRHVHTSSAPGNPTGPATGS